jgi:hypothetical protein
MVKIKSDECQCPVCGAWVEDGYCDVCQENIEERKRDKGEQDGFERIYRRRIHRDGTED